jgi:CubicO group peptidase (beta-lactamase class C family)
MTDSHWTLPAEKAGRLATLYEPVGGRLEPVDPARGTQLSDQARLNFKYHPSFPYLPASAGTHRSGGAGMVSTLSDYARFLRSVMAALLGGGRTAALGLPRVLSQVRRGRGERQGRGER